MRDLRRSSSEAQDQEQPELQVKKIELKPKKVTEHHTPKARSQTCHGRPDQGWVRLSCPTSFLGYGLSTKDSAVD